MKFIMKLSIPSLFALILLLPCSVTAQNSNATGDERLKAELRAAIALPSAERVERLKAFVEAHPLSAMTTRARELLVSARAALGDERLQAGDKEAGVAQFRQAIKDSPSGMSDKLFAEVVSQIPANLFLRGERAAAVEAARLVEAKVKDDPKRLLAVAGFYLRIEDADEAARVAKQVVKLTPDSAEAHQALGAAHHVALRLDDAATEYARALELDPRNARTRRSLADLRRATGRAEEALALYRENLKADPKDAVARAGVALSLFELGRKEEAERELGAALADEPRNLPALVGAAYWYAAHGGAERALELARRAVEIEPRYTWAHVALARALVALKRPLEAEHALRFARRYGRFPTLDYELAGALAAAGLYDEAARELARSFTIKDGQLETKLAGRTPARAADFLELLAPERRAGLFQSAAADTEENARTLKNLLALHNALNPAGGAAVNESDVTRAVNEWTAGQDGARAYRQLYVANRLLRQRVALGTILEMTEAAKGGVEAALDAPAAAVAIQADELGQIYERLAETGAPLQTTDVPRNLLSKILRGRIEHTAGYALLNQNKYAEAVPYLRRAVSVLPENSVQSRNAYWHLGAALDASGNQRDALAAYMRGYDPAAPDPVRRAVIEGLYRKVNGSLQGLDAKLGAQPQATARANAPATSPAAVTPSPSTSATANTGSETIGSTAPTNTTAPTAAPVIGGDRAAATPPNNNAPAVPSTTTIEQPVAPATSPASGNNQSAATTSVESSAARNNAPPDTTAPQTTPQPQTTTPNSPAGEQQPSAVGTNAATSTAAPSPAAPSTATSAAQPQQSDAGGCIFSVNQEQVSLRNNGGSVIVTVRFNGAGGSGALAAKTPDWSNVAVFPEPGTNTEGGAFNYSITSVSKKAGTYKVTFSSPCGTKTVAVTVK